VEVEVLVVEVDVLLVLVLVVEVVALGVPPPPAPPAPVVASLDPPQPTHRRLANKGMARVSGRAFEASFTWGINA
jgi:hypothetical protein